MVLSAPRSALFFAAYLTSISYGLPTAAAPAGWEASIRGDTEVLTRTYANGAITVFVSPWAAAEGHTVRSWLESISSEAIYGEKVTSRTNRIEDGPGDTIYVARDLRRKRGQDRGSIRFACAGRGQLRLVDSYMDAALLKDGRGPATFVDLSEIAEAACRQLPPLKLPERPDFSPGKPPEAIDAIWYMAEFSLSMGEYRSSQWGLMTFSDKQVTDNFWAFLNDGRAKSMQENPGDWGRRRILGGDLEVDWNGNGDYRDYYVSMKAEPGGRDDRVQGCFRSTMTSSSPLSGAWESGSSRAFNTATAINKMCFGKNGRFSKETMVSISASTGETPLSTSRADATGYGESDQNGWYRVDGHVLQLVYDNGDSVTTSIAFTQRNDPKRRGILIGGKYLD